MAKNETILKDANNIAELSKCDIIISCQGGDYTSAVFPQLRASGWNGYWIDAASTLRMEKDAVIVLDPSTCTSSRMRWARASRTTSRQLHRLVHVMGWAACSTV